MPFPSYSPFSNHSLLLIDRVKSGCLLPNSPSFSSLAAARGLCSSSLSTLASDGRSVLVEMSPFKTQSLACGIKHRYLLKQGDNEFIEFTSATPNLSRFHAFWENVKPIHHLPVNENNGYPYIQDLSSLLCYRELLISFTSGIMINKSCFFYLSAKGRTRKQQLLPLDN